MVSFSAITIFALIGAFALVNCQDGRGGLAPGCSGKVMDIFFVMDSSSSIYINDYLSQHRLVQGIVRRLDVSPESTRVGMLTFSDNIELPVTGLDRYVNKDVLLQSISSQNFPYRTGVTNTDMAIRHVREIRNFRQDITKVMVVMTDGGSRSPGSTINEANLARNAGFYMFVVGIGQYIDEAEWRSIANDPDNKFVYNITSPNLLDQVQFSLPTYACELPPIVNVGSCTVNEVSEIYVVASASASDASITLMNDFGTRMRDQRNMLRVNYLVDGCATANNVALRRDRPFECDTIDPRTGIPIDPVGAENMFSQAVNSLETSRRRSSGRSRKIIVLFADDQTMDSSRYDLANYARNEDRHSDSTVIVVYLGSRHRSFVQNMVSPRNLISFSGGSLVRQTNGLRQLVGAICDGMNGDPISPFEGIVN